MASAEINVSLQPGTIRDLEEQIRKLAVKQVGSLVEAYLVTLSNDDGGGTYGSSREQAARELGGFIDWVESREAVDG